MKKLITTMDIKEKLATGAKEIYLDDDTIITPAAHDAAKEQGIRLIKAEAIGLRIAARRRRCAAGRKGSTPPWWRGGVREVMGSMGGVLPRSW